MMGTGSSHTVERSHRGAWVTVAAMILIVGGVLELAYAPILSGDRLPANALLILIASHSVVCIATGIGLLRLRDWARFAAGALASLAVLFGASAIVRTTIDVLPWIALVANLVVLFAVARRWDASTEGRHGPGDTT